MASSGRLRPCSVSRRSSRGRRKEQKQPQQSLRTTASSSAQDVAGEQYLPRPPGDVASASGQDMERDNAFRSPSPIPPNSDAQNSRHVQPERDTEGYVNQIQGEPRARVQKRPATSDDVVRVTKRRKAEGTMTTDELEVSLPYAYWSNNADAVRATMKEFLNGD
ncbi:hypothetical protein SCHPADRAFT_947069 [Schizopora paradoxa]|uniref:Uncharacterized protein n=1 Tax=Schizopora paradoxa TaxID=27342 RepID=A0A0H2RKB7_9AGAM|nr:hypothetical protein SCHPADRAFT_947069 [Schizopora paradoxa]